MIEYTASNGTRVRLDEVGDLDISSPSGWAGLCGGHVLVALREFFQHERDEELGRWRWPENPEYVVYLRGDGCATTVSEVSGRSWSAERGYGPTGSILSAAVVAYFEAHPERKTAEAKPGEVWELTLDDGGEHTVFIHTDRTVGGRDGISAGGAYFDIDDGSNVVSARKIWGPEVSS